MRFLIILLVCAAHQSVAQDTVDGEKLFQLHCASCHGSGAAGNGPMSQVLTVQPSDLTSMTRRHGGTFPVERIVTRIDGRDPLVSHGSEMPVYGWFFEGSDVAVKTPAGQPMMTSRPVADLLAWLRTIQD